MPAINPNKTIDTQVALGQLTLRLKLHPSTGIMVGETVHLAIPIERCRTLAG